MVASCLLAGCAATEEPELVASGVSHLETTPTSLIADGVIAADEELRFELVAPAAPGYVVVALSGTGDADLYTSTGGAASVDDYDCRPYRPGSDERCVHLRVDGVVHVLLRGWAPLSHYHLEIVFRGIGTTP